MKFNDLVALAKAGYTVADVKELLALDIKEADQNPAPEPNPAEGAAEQQGTEPEQPKPQNEPEGTPNAGAVNIEALQKQIADLQTQLEAAQKINVTQVDFSAKDPAKTGEELAEEIARRFM